MVDNNKELSVTVHFIQRRGIHFFFFVSSISSKSDKHSWKETTFVDYDHFEKNFYLH